MNTIKLLILIVSTLTAVFMAAVVWLRREMHRLKMRRLHNSRLSCQWRFVRNVYGDEINALDGVRSIWRCRYCDALGYGDREFIGKDQYTIGSVEVWKV